MSKIEMDETSEQTAERTASAISAFVAATAIRLAHGPHGDVSPEERAAYARMRNALLDLASLEYDRGYRRAVAIQKENRARSSHPDGDET